MKTLYQSVKVTRDGVAWDVPNVAAVYGAAAVFSAVTAPDGTEVTPMHVPILTGEIIHLRLTIPFPETGEWAPVYSLEVRPSA